MTQSDAYLDNAMAERFFSTLKTALADGHVWPSRAAARAAIFEWIAVFYNRRRRHAARGYQPPAAFEEVLLLSNCTASR